MIGTIYMFKYLWSIKLMFCESISRPRSVEFWNWGLDFRRDVASRTRSRQGPGKPLEISPYKLVFLYGRFCDLIFRGSLM